MATPITYSKADGIDRNEPGGAAELLDLIAGGRPSWHRDASCIEHPELSWFPDKADDTTAAKAVCARCLVVGECRSWALAQGPGLVGIWGGLSARARLQRRRAA